MALCMAEQPAKQAKAPEAAMDAAAIVPDAEVLARQPESPLLTDDKALAAALGRLDTVVASRRITKVRRLHTLVKYVRDCALPGRHTLAVVALRPLAYLHPSY